MTGLDRRLHAYRDDLAAEALRDQVAAPRYAAASVYQVVSPLAPVRRAPDDGAPLDTQALMGEIVDIYEIKDGWAWGQLRQDGYVGYLPASSLGVAQTMTHRVTALETFIFPAPDIKSVPCATIHLNGQVCVRGETGRFAELADGSYVVARHLGELVQSSKADFVQIGERMIATPYLWGGKSRHGIDCSGLVQLAMQAAGLTAPRDSDMQEAAIGSPVSTTDLTQLQRGDLVFWPGHVGIMTNPEHLLHANAFHMETVIEPLDDVVRRIGQSSGDIRSIRRP